MPECWTANRLRRPRFTRSEVPSGRIGAESINENRGMRAARIDAAQALIELGDSADAWQIAQLMLDAAEDNESTIARAHWLFGRANLADRAYETARDEFTLTLDYARLNGDGLILSHAGAGLVEIYLATGDLEAARKHVEEIRPHANTGHDFKRLYAKPAQAEGESSKALDIMMSLRSEGWTPEDDALLAELRDN